MSCFFFSSSSKKNDSATMSLHDETLYLVLMRCRGIVESRLTALEPPLPRPGFLPPLDRDRTERNVDISPLSSI